MKVRIGIQIRPLMWLLTPIKEVEKKTLANYYKYKFLCFELLIRIEKMKL
jgi:hypothetical protein